MRSFFDSPLNLVPWSRFDFFDEVVNQILWAEDEEDNVEEQLFAIWMGWTDEF